MALTPNPAGRVNVPDIRPPRGTLLLIPDAATYLGRTERYVRRLVAERTVPHVKMGNRIAFYEDDLRDYLAACEVPAREGR